MSSIFIDVAIAVTAANWVDVIPTDYIATNTLILGDYCDFEGSNSNQCGKRVPRAEKCQADAESVVRSTSYPSVSIKL
jgi:hypothetical protein